MNTINIKPLSVNKAYTGQRFKTNEYRAFRKQVLLSLKPFKVPLTHLKVYYEFGFNSEASDIDNPVKCITDVLQNKYGFNDKLIYELHVVKKIVKKGEEYIKFKIESL